VNLYSTKWANRQFTRDYTDDEGVDGSANFTGVSQLHHGIEIDFRLNPISTLTITGMASIGNWRYTDNFSGDRFDDNNVYLDTRTLYTKDSKIPDAAQTTFNLGADYQIVRNLNVYGSYYYADDLYADFNIASDNSFNNPPEPGEDANQSWQLPSYSLVDAGVSYQFKLGNVNLTWRFNINNLFDEEYISESDTNVLFDPSSGTDREVGKKGSINNRVYYGLGRTWNTSLKVSF
jgi:outer membrane receptor protein involved in Fe transport